MRWPLLLLVCGCSEDPATFDLRDGWRLELRYWTYEDGTRQWDPSTYFDAALRADCRPMRWSDGHTYCTPESGAVAYADGNCDLPIGQVATGVEPPIAFRRDYVFESQQVPSRMYVRGAERAPLTEVWFYANNECTGPFEDAGARYFEVEDVPMVRLLASAPHGDGRVRAAIVTTDDGMQAPSTLHDSLVGVDCTPVTAQDGSTTCEPVQAVEATYFRDAACSTAALVIRDDMPVPAVARMTDDSGCSSYYRVGREGLSYPLFARSGSACVEVTLPYHDRVFEVGEPVAASLEQRHTAQAGRLQAVELVDGSLHVPAPLLFDSVLGVPCERRAFGDFALCIPRAITMMQRSYFPNDTCQGYVYGMPVPGRACEPEPVIGQYVSSTTVKFFELAPPSTQPLWELDQDGCKPVLRDDIRLIGPQIQLGTFVAAVRE